MSAATSTTYLNSKKRRIFQSERGVFFALSTIVPNKRMYGIKAAYRNTNGNTSRTRITKNSLANVPTAIKPARVARNAVVAPAGPRMKKHALRIFKKSNPFNILRKA